MKNQTFLTIDSINNKKFSTSLIQNHNTSFKSFFYHEDKNLQFSQSMEDIDIMIPYLTTDNKASSLAIFDGHVGSDVVKF